MIAGASKVSTDAVATPFAGGIKGDQEQQQQQNQPESSSSLSLQMLVALASTLFDQAALEEKQLQLQAQLHLAQKQQEIDDEDAERKRKQQKQQQESFFLSLRDSDSRLNSQTNGAVGQKRENSSDLFISSQHGHMAKVTKRPPIGICKIRSSSSNNNTLQPVSFQCCTREGFLARLRSVLNDPSRSDALSWMPDGKAFTIVSSKRFSKSGMVYELFGIRKMSSFLRRLNQLGFARIRDPTDPNNLDVFRKIGFESSLFHSATTTITTRRSTTISTTKAAQRLDSPTSTLQFSSTMATTDDEMNTGIKCNNLALPSPGSSFVSMGPRLSSPLDDTSSLSTTGTRTTSSSDNVGFESSSSSTTPSFCVCTTPESGELSQIQPQPTGIGRLLSIPSAF